MNNECGWITLAGTSLGREALIKSEKTDWLIIGAGITGLCAAHTLAQMHPQARIVIVDRQRAAQGASARNSGFSVAHENPSDAELIGNRGFADFEVDTFISVAASQEVRQRIERHSIDCEYRDSGYFLPLTTRASWHTSRPRSKRCRLWGLLLIFCKAMRWPEPWVPSIIIRLFGAATVMPCSNLPSM